MFRKSNQKQVGGDGLIPPMILTLTSPKTTAQTSNKFANITIAPPKMPNLSFEDPVDEKQGDM